MSAAGPPEGRSIGSQPEHQAGLTADAPQGAAERPVPRALPPVSSLRARDGRDAVTLIERLVCGTGAVAEPAVAEGRALAGTAAAVLPPRVRDANAIRLGAGARTPLVVHRDSPARVLDGWRPAFELLAATVQEAADHCLVAHVLARRVGRAGVCTLGSGLAESIERFTMPDRDLVRSLVDGAEPPGPGADPGADVAAAAHEAFARVARALGRDVAPLSSDVPPSAEIALVAAGPAAAAAREAARHLEDAGVPAGTISLALVDPLPAGRLREILCNVSTVAVIGEAAPGAARLPAALLRALDGTGAEIVEVDAGADGVPGDPEQLVAMLRPDLPRRGSARETGPAEAPVCIAAAPGGAAADELLLDTAALLGSFAPVRAARCAEPSRGMTSVVLAEREPAECSEIDVLFVPTAAAIDAVAAAAMREGGAIVVAGDAGTARFSARQSRAIAERKLEVFHVASATAPASLTPEAGAERERWMGGILAAAGAQSAMQERGLGALAVWQRWLASLGAADDAQTWRHVAEGARAVSRLEPGAPAAGEELESGPPRMPSPADAAPAAAARVAVRAFHIGGTRESQRDHAPQTFGLWPAIAEDLSDPTLPWLSYPFVSEPNGERRPLAQLVRDRLGAMERDSGSKPVLARLVERLAAATNAAAAEAGAVADVAELLRRGGAELTKSVDASEETIRQLAGEIDTLAEAAPEGARLVPLAASTHLELLALLLEEEASRRSARVIAEIDVLVARLDQLLEVDASLSPQAAAPDALESALGPAAVRFVNAAPLSKAVGPPRGSSRLSAERREGVERTRRLLANARERMRQPRWFVLQSDRHPRGLPKGGPFVIEHHDPFEAAIGLFDGLATETVELVRAMRRAGLELEHSFDPDRHEPVLERLDWQGLSRSELLAAPPVVVCATTDELRHGILGSFSELLRSSRPVRVIVDDPPRASGAGGRGALTDYQLDPAYLAIAHREAFVLRSTLAEPQHLTRGLETMLAAPRPAVAVVAVAGEGPAPDWVQLLAATRGRATPLLLHDPERGLSWAERFELGENPDPDLAWPVQTLRWIDAEGVERNEERPFTFAEAAALFPAFREHFLVVGPEAWSDDQVEIGAWLALDELESLERVPFVWIVDESAVLQRALVTRELAFATRDRARGWHVLQELAGRDNEHVRRAIESARRELTEQAGRERDSLMATHEEEVERVRNTAAAEAIERLAAALLDSGASLASAPAAVRPEAAPPPPVAAAEPAPEAAPAAEPEDDDELLLATEPYIDSLLCTTCNDCTNLNPRMFRYNADKQAYLADASAGTFEQLVIAAEKCPARCIHPGAPPDGDETVTDALIERARAFN